MSRVPSKVLLRHVVAVVLGCALASSISEAGSPLPDAGQPVIRFSEGFGEAAGDPRIVLEIFDDGRAVVTRPAFAKGSARAETRLDRSEVAELLASMVAHGVLEFDATCARRELRAAEAERAQKARARPGEVELVTWTDPDPTTLEVRARDVVHVASWAGLRGDAALHPEIASLRALHEAQEELRAIIAREDLR